jgi:hypothetical protein
MTPLLGFAQSANPEPGVIPSVARGILTLFFAARMNARQRFPSISISTRCGLPDLKAASTAALMSSAFET